MYRCSYACKIHVVKQKHTYYVWNATYKNYKDHDGAKAWAYVRQVLQILYLRNHPMKINYTSYKYINDLKHIYNARLYILSQTELHFIYDDSMTPMEEPPSHSTRESL
jgi:hypothetical protein